MPSSIGNDERSAGSIFKSKSVNCYWNYRWLVEGALYAVVYNQSIVLVRFISATCWTGRYCFQPFNCEKGEQTWTRDSTSKEKEQNKRKCILNGSSFVLQNPWIHELTKKQKKNTLWSPVLVGGTSVHSEIEGSGWLVYCYSWTTPYILSWNKRMSPSSRTICFIYSSGTDGYNYTIELVFSKLR